MNPVERWSQHLSNLLVGGTGAVYAVMRYGLKPQDPWAVVNHPLQPRVQHLHVLVAPLLVFAVGLIWQRHIAPRLRLSGQTGYLSGILLAVSLVPMVVSGYLIQTAVGERWRGVWVTVHLVTSAFWLAGYLAHQWRTRRLPDSP